MWVLSIDNVGEEGQRNAVLSKGMYTFKMMYLPDFYLCFMYFCRNRRTFRWSAHKTWLLTIILKHYKWQLLPKEPQNFISISML